MSYFYGQHMHQYFLCNYISNCEHYHLNGTCWQDPDWLMLKLISNKWHVIIRRRGKDSISTLPVTGR